MAASVQSYELSFNPSEGLFHLEGIDGTPTPDHLQFIVTEPDSSIQITCKDGLSFKAVGPESPVFWHPTNTFTGEVHDPSTTSIKLVFPTPPAPHDKVGFTLKAQFASGPKRIPLLPELYVTAEQLETPSFLELVYTPADGSFNLLHGRQDETMDAEVITRLGTGGSNQGGSFEVKLITVDAAPGEAARFVSPGVSFTDKNSDRIQSFSGEALRLKIPFNSNSGVGMNFIIQYADVTIHSPDPIIVDKTIGTNPGPGF